MMHVHPFHGVVFSVTMAKRNAYTRYSIDVRFFNQSAVRHFTISLIFRYFFVDSRLTFYQYSLPTFQSTFTFAYCFTFLSLSLSFHFICCFNRDNDIMKGKRIKFVCVLEKRVVFH